MACSAEFGEQWNAAGGQVGVVKLRVTWWWSVGSRTSATVMVLRC
jgi:hypothetical protein